MAFYGKPNKFCFLVFTLVCASLSAAAANAAVYYVSPSGNDQSTGCEGQPWLTIQKAADTVSGGDTVMVRPGSYNERVTIDRSGTPRNKIVFKSAGSRAAIVKGFEIKGDHVRVEGFQVIDRSGVYNVYSIAARGADNEITDNYVETHWGGIASSGGAGLVSHNYLYKPQQGLGVSSSNSRVEGNEVCGLKQWIPGHDSDYMRFFGSNNVIRGNYFHGMDVREVGDSHSDCFQSFDDNGADGSVSNTIIEDNVCVNSMEGIIIEASHYRKTNNVIIRNNVFECILAYAVLLRSISDAYIYNNTITNSGSKGIACVDKGCSCNVNNNIIYFSNSAYYAYSGGTLNSKDHNMLYKGTQHLMGLFSAADFPADVINQDPKFNNINIDLRETYKNAAGSYRGDSSHFETRAGYQAAFIPGEYLEFCPGLLCDGIPRKITSVGNDGIVGFTPAIDNYASACDASAFFIKLWGNNGTNYVLDLHLRHDSPARNAGTMHRELDYDIDGNPRPVSAGSGWDIGAYQSAGR